MTTYSEIHKRVGELRGKALEHKCIDCGRPVVHWTYNNAAGERELSALIAGGCVNPVRYSSDINDYDPRCRKCHRRFDHLHRRITRKPISDDDPSRRKMLTVGDAADQLGISKYHVRGLISNGELRAYHVGSTVSIRVDADDVAALLRPVRPQALAAPLKPPTPLRRTRQRRKATR